MKIEIINKNKTEKGWNFTVQVDDLSYAVEVEQEYYQKLTKGKIEPAVLVKKSFEFLLEREPKESILRTFNIKVISKYFPEYEQEILP